jgi:hypothetical protein
MAFLTGLGFGKVVEDSVFWEEGADESRPTDDGGRVSNWVLAPFTKLSRAGAIL